MGHEYHTKVSNTDFFNFVNTEIKPRFTRFRSSMSKGTYNGKEQDITIITITSEEIDDAFMIYDIAEAYKKRFYQDSIVINSFTSFPSEV